MPRHSSLRMSINYVLLFVRHDDGGFVFLHNFQDHVITHDLADLQLAIQTSSGEIRIPNDSTFTLKNETATFFPFNLDFGGGPRPVRHCPAVGVSDWRRRTALCFCSHRWNRTAVCLRFKTGRSNSQQRLRGLQPRFRLRRAMSVRQRIRIHRWRRSR